MDRPINISNHNEKDFWDSLQTEIIKSSTELTRDELICIEERNYMFSLFYRKTNYKELIAFQHLCNLQDNVAFILIDILPTAKNPATEVSIDDIELYHFVKQFIPHEVTNGVGPLIVNRFSVLVSEHDSILPVDIARILVDRLHQKYHYTICAGVGNIVSLQNISSSILEVVSSLHRCKPGRIFEAKDLTPLSPDHRDEYLTAERHMLESVRLKKVDAYDYFMLMMNHLSTLDDDVKRNKIIEALVLASHAAHIDRDEITNFFNYTGQICKLMHLKGSELVDWALQSFICVTGFVKSQSSIDYSNKIVQATKDYLEAHYVEEISLESMAAEVNISPQYLSKLIKKNTGFNFIDWLSMLRVKKAKELLTDSNYTVKEVCFLVGYKDPNYFSRIFKKRIGITPSEFVKNQEYINNSKES